jgi:hypothetical protein
MNQRTIIGLTTTMLLGTGVVFNASQAPAQQTTLKQQLAGAWLIASIDQTDRDGKKVQLFGANPKGSQFFDASGQWIQIIWNPDVPKFKVNSRIKGTPEENSAAVHAITSSFGTWTVDEATKTLTVRYTGSMFPNQAGTESKRIVSVTGDELRVSNPMTGSGMKSDTVWRRAK